MKCPVCKFELVHNGSARMETLDHHICLPNEDPPMAPKYTCSNDNCSTIDVCFWDQYGEGPFVRVYDKFKEIEFIDNINSPFGSWWRKNAVESITKDITLVKIFKIKAYIHITSVSNEDGDIIKHNYSLRICKYDKYGCEHHLGISMIIFEAKSFFQAYRTKNLIKYVDEIKNRAEGSNLEYWRRFNVWWMPKVLYLLLDWFGYKDNSFKKFFITFDEDHVHIINRKLLTHKTVAVISERNLGYAQRLANKTFGNRWKYIYPNDDWDCKMDDYPEGLVVLNV